MNAVQEEWEKMSYVLIEVFGLTDKQVQEIERNDGLTNVDLEAE